MTKDSKYAGAVMALRKSGISYGQIAERLKLTRNQVAGAVYRSGGTKNADNARHTTDPAFRALVVADKIGTWSQIAARWGLSTSTLGCWRRGLGCEK